MSKRNPRFHDIAVACLAAAALARGQAPLPKDISFGGGASINYGEIMKSSDTSSFHYSKNRIQSVGAQFAMGARFSERFNVDAGLGIVERHYLSGSIGDNGGRTPFVWSPYVVKADFQYAFWNGDGRRLALTGGYFPYSYNPDVKDLGLYLTRGPVYPGILISGYDSKYTKPIANTLGLRLQHQAGGFEHNLLATSEIENYPLFDLSLVYIAGYDFGKALHIGGGVNLYHVLPIDRKLTSPDTFAYDGSDFSAYNGNPYSRTWVYIDSLAHDTTHLSFAGTKVMANASFDPKAFFDSGAFGPEDLKLYGEVALIGLKNTAPYRALYGDYKHRMPVMVGFNIPAFRFLDHLSLEVEWYGAKFKDDLARFQATTANPQSPLPVQNPTHLDLGRDDWKWALHATKTMGQFQLMAMAANDHTRSGGTLTSPSSEWESIFVTPKDWYWVARAGFFF
jgi:hypothetical protein